MPLHRHGCHRAFSICPKVYRQTWESETRLICRSRLPLTLTAIAAALSTDSIPIVRVRGMNFRRFSLSSAWHTLQKVTIKKVTDSCYFDGEIVISTACSSSSSRFLSMHLCITLHLQSVNLRTCGFERGVFAIDPSRDKFSATCAWVIARSPAAPGGSIRGATKRCITVTLGLLLAATAIHGS